MTDAATIQRNAQLLDMHTAKCHACGDLTVTQTRRPGSVICSGCAERDRQEDDA